MYRPTRFNTLKKKNERASIRDGHGAGISSVVTQLVTIREFLAQFDGNEFVIALIFFCWLILGGLGTLLARLTNVRSTGRFRNKIWLQNKIRRATIDRLAWLSLSLAAFSTVQILAIRELRDIFFIPGSSVGFYPTLAYTFFTIAPYTLLVGFVLPYSLFVLRNDTPDYPGARIYITDNLGDTAGGALFSFVLVYLVTPFWAIFLANLPLFFVTCLLFSRRSIVVFLGAGIAFSILLSGVFLERRTLEPAVGELIYWSESRYGRVAVHRDAEQYTLLSDGVPLFSNQNVNMAEEAIHYPLSQINRVQHILLISAEGGMMAEIEKYKPETVDYVELDPEVSKVLFNFGLIKKISGLNVIHRDGRAFLADSDKIYDAIIINLPEPATFQINRFFTDRFFKLAKNHLAPNGVLSFSIQGFDNYLAEPQRQKLSSLYNTVADYFEHILLLPGLKIFFICRSLPIEPDIPTRLAQKKISTGYVHAFFYGNLTKERIKYLNEAVDPATPKNSDGSPRLIRLMFSQWFAKFATSPAVFFVVLAILSLIYLVFITKEEFVLFSTGAMVMGSEIIIIFVFEIFFGYIYFQIGMIVTVFLAGLMPGAFLGDRLSGHGIRLIGITDGLLIILMGILIPAIWLGGDRLPVTVYLGFGFVVSLLCGFQFPVALALRGGGNSAVTRTFSADLIGAAVGILFTSVVLIPYFGIIWAVAGLIALKSISLMVVSIRHAQINPPKILIL